jgi:hypothetical protein
VIMSRVLTQIPSRLQVQIQSFVRQARSQGIEKDFINLLQGKQVPQPSVKKLDNLINKILSSSVQHQPRQGAWSEFKFDSLTNQNIVEFEIPRETREHLKQQAITEAQSEKGSNAQQRAREIYKNNFNNLRNSLVERVAQVSTQPTIPPVKVPHIPDRDLDEIDERIAHATQAEKLEIQNEGLNDPLIDNGLKELIRQVQRERAKRASQETPLPKYDYEKMTIPENQEAVQNFKRFNSLITKFFSLGYSPEDVKLLDNPIYRIIRAQYDKMELYKQNNFHLIQQHLMNVHESNVRTETDFKNIWEITAEDFYKRYPELEEEYLDRVKRSDYASYFFSQDKEEHH